MSLEKKALQVVNLSPSESWVEKLHDVHPMKQIAVASVIQVCVFGFMILSFFIINQFVGH
jgi:hypothetical protein